MIAGRPVPKPTERRWGQRLPAFLAVLLAVALRLYGLESVPHNYDRGYPHGLGIVIHEALADGRLDQLPIAGAVASINLRNPAGASYGWAVLTAIDASPFVATALVALLHAGVVTSAAYGVTRKLFGATPAFVAGVLCAVSLWGGWIGRGAWIQGTLEAFSALTFWLLFDGLRFGRPRRTYAAFALTALAAQTYLAAFGLFAQLAGALLAVWMKLLGAPMRRAVWAGVATCVASIVLFGASFLASGETLRAAVDNPNAINTDLAAGQVNWDPVAHVLRLASGRDYENTFGDAANAGRRNNASDALATMIDLLIAAGVAHTLVFRARRSASARMALAWLIVPAVAAMLIANVAMREWKVHSFYLTLASPLMYAFAGAPFALLPARARWALAAALCVAQSGMASVNLHNDVAFRRATPIDALGLEGAPLSVVERVASSVRDGCDTIVNRDDSAWLASWLGTARPLRHNGYRAANGSAIALLEPGRRACVIDTEPALTLTGAQSFATLTSPGSAAKLVISRLPVPDAGTPVSLTVNIGWSLLRLDTPLTAAPGQTIRVEHLWRIDTLPGEAYADWYYAPFVNLIGPDGARVVEINGSPAILGYEWRTGGLLLSDTVLSVPADAATGRYSLEISLFDPNQKRNAVYFDPGDPATPIVIIKRQIEIR